MLISDDTVRLPTPPSLASGTVDDVESRMKMLAIRVSEAGQTETIDDAVRHHLEAGGRRFRANLALSVATALRLQVDDRVCLASACELLHNASLVHDDLQDGDRRRRGREAVWSLFGQDTAINVGDLLISAAYAALAGVSVTTRVPALVSLLHTRVAEAIYGQSADLSLNRADLADFETYETVAAGKSGALLALPLELPLVYAGHSAFAPLAKSAAKAFAIGYQIVDDLADLSRDSGAEGHRKALNAVLVLRAAGFRESAEQHAKTRALTLFDVAVEKSRALPYDCGKALETAAAELVARL